MLHSCHYLQLSKVAINGLVPPIYHSLRLSPVTEMHVIRSRVGSLVHRATMCSRIAIKVDESRRRQRHSLVGACSVFPFTWQGWCSALVQCRSKFFHPNSDATAYSYVPGVIRRFELCHANVVSRYTRTAVCC